MCMFCNCNETSVYVYCQQFEVKTLISKYYDF